MPIAGTSERGNGDGEEVRLRQYWYRVLVPVVTLSKNSGVEWSAVNAPGRPTEQPIPTLAEARKIRTANAKAGGAIIVRSPISANPYWRSVVVP